MDDLALSPSEEAYFSSGGQDTAGVLAEAGRSEAPADRDGLPEFTDAERRYFSSRGTDVSGDLLREAGQRSEPRQQQFRPELQAFIDRAVAAHKSGHLDERVAHARTQERLSLLQQAVAPPSEPAPEPTPQLDPESDIFRYVRNLGDKLAQQEQQIETGQREMAEEGAYRASLDAAVRQDPSVYQAYQHLLHSRAAEMMASRYPQATPDQLMRAPVPADIRGILEQEERDIYKNAFAAQRNPAADILRLAQMRGYVSPQQRAAAQAAQAEQQRRQHEADAAARAKAEDVAWTERAKFAQRKAFWDEDTTHRYLTSARSNAHKRWFFDHEPGPPPALPGDFR
jgi:hypothetical protein